MGSLTLAVFLVAFIASLFLVWRGSAWHLAAHLRQKLGSSNGLVAAVVASASITAVVAALAGAWAVSQVRGIAIVIPVIAPLLIGAVIRLRAPRVKLPQEPTRSFGAIFLTLSAMQAVDAARLTILALAALSRDPWTVAAGGVLGCAAGLMLAASQRWSLSQAAERNLRLISASCLLTLAAVIAFYGLAEIVDLLSRS